MSTGMGAASRSSWIADRLTVLADLGVTIDAEIRRNLASSAETGYLLQIEFSLGAGLLGKAKAINDGTRDAYYDGNRFGQVLEYLVGVDEIELRARLVEAFEHLDAESAGVPRTSRYTLAEALPVDWYSLWVNTSDSSP